MILCILIVHQYLDRNKRMGRRFSNILLYGPKAYFLDLNYKDKRKRVIGRKEFAKGSITSGFSIIMELHNDAQISFE